MLNWCTRTLKAKSDPIELRAALESDVKALADLWHRGWILGHTKNVPRALTQLRTLASFEQRLRDQIDKTLTSGPIGKPQTFIRIIGDELEQFYVEPNSVGQGLGRRLMHAAELELVQRGILNPHLICSSGNDRAAGFYTAMGWRNAGVIWEDVETSQGPFSVEVIRFERTLAPIS